MKENFIVIMPAVVGNGAKYTATRLAKEIHRNFEDEENRVLLLDFNFDYPYLAKELIEEGEHPTVDDVFPLLTESLEENKKLLKEFVIETMIDGVDLLKGTNFAGIKNHLSPEQIQYTIDAAKDSYEYVVAVVAPTTNNLATIYSLINADKLILVLRQNHANYGHLPMTIKLLRQYYTKSEQIRLVYNYDSAFSEVDVNELLENSFLPIRAVTTLVYDEKSVDDRDLLKETGLFQSKPLNAKAISKIHDDLIEEEE